ncbi:MAG: elongation factor P [Alphaproteobacteria bacterium]
MKINGNEIRPGNVVEHQGSLWVAVKTNAVKPGKGPAYNQVELKNLLNGSKLNERFRQDGMTVVVESHEGRPIGISLPDQVTLTIAEADPVVKGQTAASSYKPAIMENGVRVMVPPFITAGEKIIVDTNELTYVKRAE